jgi:hypothetical protein
MGTGSRPNFTAAAQNQVDQMSDLEEDKFELDEMEEDQEA